MKICKRYYLTGEILIPGFSEGMNHVQRAAATIGQIARNELIGIAVVLQLIFVLFLVTFHAWQISLGSLLDSHFSSDILSPHDESPIVYLADYARW